jgi:hypothetical protein
MAILTTVYLHYSYNSFYVDQLEKSRLLMSKCESTIYLYFRSFEAGSLSFSSEYKNSYNGTKNIYVTYTWNDSEIKTDKVASSQFDTFSTKFNNVTFSAPNRCWKTRLWFLVYILLKFLDNIELYHQYIL